MTIKEKREESKLTVYVEGSVDTNTAPELLEFLQKEMHDITYLLLDFKDVNYVSSAGLRVILFAQKTMNSLGELALTNVNEDIMETLELTGFTDILTII